MSDGDLAVHLVIGFVFSLIAIVVVMIVVATISNLAYMLIAGFITTVICGIAVARSRPK